MCTGEAEVLDLGPMVRKGEVAWLHKRDMPGSEAAVGRASQQHSPNSPQQAGSKKRKVALSAHHRLVDPIMDWHCCFLLCCMHQLAA